jgi:hypothetical protein
MNTHAKHLTVGQKIALAIKNFFNPLDMHVKISNEGKAVLKDPQLTRLLVKTMIDKKKQLEKGDPVTVTEGETTLTVTVVEPNVEEHVASS